MTAGAWAKKLQNKSEFPGRPLLAAPGPSPRGPSGPPRPCRGSQHSEDLRKCPRTRPARGMQCGGQRLPAQTGRGELSAPAAAAGEGAKGGRVRGKVDADWLVQTQQKGWLPCAQSAESPPTHTHQLLPAPPTEAVATQPACSQPQSSSTLPHSVRLTSVSRAKSPTTGPQLGCV